MDNKKQTLEYIGNVTIIVFDIYVIYGMRMGDNHLIL